MSDKLTYKFLKLISGVIKHSPQWLKKCYIKGLYLILFYIFPIRKKMMATNLKNAFPDKSSDWLLNTIKNCYKFFISQLIQFFAFPKSFSNANINLIGEDLVGSVETNKSGTIFVSGHFGAWEMLAAWFGHNKFPITAVAAKQKNRGSNNFFIEHRSIFGMKHIYRRSSLVNMYKVLKDNEILALVSDQDAKRRGVFVDFFGRKTSTPKGTARFHIETGAPIIFTVCYQTSPNHYTIEFIPIEPTLNASIEQITQQYTSILEGFIRKYPEQYFWFHRRWKTKPELAK